MLSSTEYQARAARELEEAKARVCELDAQIQALILDYNAGMAMVRALRATIGVK